MTRATTSPKVVAAAAAVVTNPARGGKGGDRAYEEAVRVGLKGCARDQTCVSWCSRLPTLRLNARRWGLALVVERLGKVRGSAGRDHRVLQGLPGATIVC